MATCYTLCDRSCTLVDRLEGYVCTDRFKGRVSEVIYHILCKPRSCIVVVVELTVRWVNTCEQSKDKVQKAKYCR
jgi:hypothetical protein